MECDLIDDGGIFITTGRVIACDPKEIVFDNQLSEDHVGVSIFYCPSNVSTIMTIWKWPLAKMNLDGYSFKQLLISYNESHITIVDEEGETGVRKKQYTFQKRNEM